jgi:predicted RNA-binding Zn ribbon-like protein
MAALRLPPDVAAWAGFAAALVNTRPRPADPPEKLEAAADLQALLDAAPEPAPRPAADADVDAARALRGVLLGAFRARDRAEAAAALNPLLARWALRPAADGSWELGPVRDADLSDWLAANSARGLAELVAAYGLERLHECSAEDCQAVLVDVSRNGARRFCSRTCASRVNVRRHRHPV